MNFQRRDLIIFFVVNLFFPSCDNCDARVQMHQHSAVVDNLFHKFEQEKIQLTKPKNQTLLVRLPLNILLKYKAYKDVSLLHFKVPDDTRTAFFAFKAYEEGMSTFHRKCKPRNVDIHLKAGSYPVVSPENITFPKNFLSASQRSKIYSLQLQSNEEQHHVLIESPQLGDWFAVAFISWTDPNTDRIEQQGLTPSCDTLLFAEMSILKIQPSILSDDFQQSVVLSMCDDSSGSYRNKDYGKNSDNDQGNMKIRNEYIYKFYVPSAISIATALISIVDACKECPDIVFRIQSKAFPKSVNGNSDEQTPIQSIHIIKSNQTGSISFAFHVQEEAWHYMHVEFFKKKKIQSERWKTKLNNTFDSQNEDSFSILEINSTQSESEYFKEYKRSKNMNNAKCLEEQNKESKTYCFQVEYSFKINFQTFQENLHNESGETEPTFAAKIVRPETSNENITIDLLNHSSKEWQPKRFRGIDFYPLLRQTYREFFMFDYDLMPDENGNVPLYLNLTTNEHVGFAFDVGEVHDIGGTLTFAISMNKELEFKSITLQDLFSIDIGEDSIITDNDKNDEVRTLFRNNKIILVCIHLSEPGIPIWPNKCRYGELVFPAAIIINNTDISSITGVVHVPFPESGRWYISMALYCQGVEQQLALNNCNTSVVFTISSNPCISGRCGRYGRCYHYMSGGFVFSTCVCTKGYRGWDCTEDSQVPSSFSILAATLLLTLSNLIFLPSIYIAIRRFYYTEATIYFFAMFFSILYHACDSGEDEYNFCLVKVGVLQFCDFYCGLLAIWVTLIAMSHIRQQFVSILHIFGAILLAFGTELNKQSLWVFLAPALTGTCLISTSWGLRCYKMRKWYPSTRYLKIYLPLGMVLVLGGLICFAFLQTKQNYHIVHSIWHIEMALSILCLLPSRKYFIKKW